MVCRKTLLGALVRICTLVLAFASPAVAFDAPSRIDRSLSLSAECRLYVFVQNLNGGLASVRVSPLGSGSSTQTQAAGGASFFNGSITTIFPSITASNLEANCGLSDVTAPVQFGAAGTYSAHDYMSVSFEGTRTFDGDRYAYLAEISGVTGTTVSINQTLVNSAPTVTLGSLSGPDSSGNYTVAATLSENSSDFNLASLTLENATATMSGSGRNYTIVLTATGSKSAAVSVQKGAFTDSEGLANWFASNEVGFKGSAPTSKVIAQFLQSRANQLITSQPDLTGFLSGNRSGGLNLSVTQAEGDFLFMSPATADSNFWITLNGFWTTEDTRESQYVFGAFGSHFTVSPDLLIGAMIEFDYLSQDDGASNVNGQGWLAGGYVVARAASHPLFFDGRVLYGQTTNDVSPLGTYTDRFSTDRALAQAKVTGEMAYGATTLFPSMQLSYTTDDQHSYIDSLGNDISAQSIELWQAELGLDFSHYVLLRSSDTSLELTGGIAAIGSSTKTKGDAKSIIPEYEGGRGQLTLGANYTMANGGIFSVDTLYDGIGASDYKAYGIEVGLNLEF